MRIGPEDKELIKVFDWLRLNKPIVRHCFHFANERKCSIQYGLLLKRKGVRSGIADIFVGIPSKGYHALWVELKTENRKPTESQKIFLADRIEMGDMAVCVWEFEGAKHVILEYLGLNDWAPF